MTSSETELHPIPEGSFISVRTRARLLAVILVFLRLPFLDHPKPVHPDELEIVDSIGFPKPYPVHPPGYPLWTALGTVLAKVSRGEYQAFQILSVIGSAAGSVFLYLILRRWVCADGVAWLVALAMGLNPLMWFHATTALNYCMACAAALAVVFFLGRSVAENRPRDLKIATAVFAFSLFLRPDLLLWIGPLWAALAIRHPVRVWVPSALVLAVASIGTWQATGYLYGRTDVGRAALSHTREVIWNTSIFHLGLRDGLMRNTLKLAVNFIWDFGILTPFLLPAWKAARRGEGPARHATNIAMLAAVPLIAFAVLIHMSEPGHVMLLLPVGYAILAAGLSRLSIGAGKRWGVAILVSGAAQFLLYPWSLTSENYKRLVDAKIGYISAAGLRQIDRRPEIHRTGDYWPTVASRAQSMPRATTTDVAPGFSAVSEDNPRPGPMPSTQQTGGAP